MDEELGDELDHTVETVLDNLEAVGVVEELEPSGPSTFILKERTGEYPMGEDVDLGAHVDEERERFLEDLHAREAEREAAPLADGGADESTLRGVASQALDVSPENLEDAMASGEEAERMNKLDKVVGAIKDSDEVEKGEGYDQIGFRNGALRYRLTHKAAGTPIRGGAA
ncbi:hypothetical protein [Halomarina litorea]|uniref:hypothetical protein n=1 Tax=Halomarina litorea TaxID=2961595 RepID=UPI0020C24ABA|nr:hypothetical protein [Halomarina sp. BCD28]